MNELMTQLNGQMASLPQWVQIWMNWMLFIFLAAVVFVYKFKAARYVLAAFILTMPVGLLIFYLSNNAHLLGIAHIIIWAPLLYGLIQYEVRAKHFKFTSIYGAWLGLLILTIIVSLVFDIRDIVLILLGHK